MNRQCFAILLGALVILGATGASAMGWLGDVEVCGADRALGCIAWPMSVSLLVWAAFILGVAALILWQVRYLDR